MVLQPDPSPPSLSCSERWEQVLLDCASTAPCASGFSLGLTSEWHWQQVGRWEEREARLFLPYSLPVWTTGADIAQSTQPFTTSAPACQPTVHGLHSSLTSAALSPPLALLVLKHLHLRCLNGILLPSGILTMIQTYCEHYRGNPQAETVPTNLPRTFPISFTIKVPTSPPMANMDTVTDQSRVRVSGSTGCPYLLSHDSL